VTLVTQLAHAPTRQILSEKDLGNPSMGDVDVVLGRQQGCDGAQ